MGFELVSNFASGTDDDARFSRAERSLSEALLWRELRSRPSGLRFSRQRTTGKYVHDFYCFDARLGIDLQRFSVDGAEQPLRDPARESWLENAGIETMQVPESPLIAEARLAADEIISRAKRRLPHDHPALIEKTAA